MIIRNCCLRGGVVVLLISSRCPVGGPASDAYAQPSSTANQENASSDPRAIELFRNAAALQNRQLYDLAAAEWHGLIRQFGKDPLAVKARQYHGVCLFQTGKYAAAAALFEKVLQQQADFELLEETYANLGLARFNHSQAVNDQSRRKMLLDATIVALSEQLERFPAGKLAPQAHFYRAEALYANQQLEQAVASYAPFTDSFGTHPLRPQALYGLGVAQQELNQPAAAGSTFEVFLAAYPRHDLTNEVILRRGETLVATGQFNEAEARFAKVAAAADFPDADYALERQAVCRHEAKDYLGAAELYVALFTRFPKSSLANEATLSAGKCFYAGDDLEQANRWFAQARDLGVGGQEASHWLARSLIRTGKPAEALKEVESALKARPTDDIRIDLELDRADDVAHDEERREH